MVGLISKCERYDKMNILKESMTRLVLDSNYVRIWREETEHITNESHKQINEMACNIWRDLFIANGRQYNIDREKLAMNILSLDRVNAVEVVDFRGNGAVYYKDWP